MRFRSIVGALFFVIFLNACSSAPKKIPQSPFEKMKLPTVDVNESVGFTSRGCLLGGEKIEDEGTGYTRVRLNRNRGYGNKNLIELLHKFGLFSAEKLNRKVIFSDLSLPRGGPFSSDHASHQTGLDVDVWYDTLTAQEKLSVDDKETRVVTDLGLSPKELKRENWNEALHPALLKWLSQANEVERVFVGAVIKRELCEKFRGEGWLTKIRIWYGHTDHFHVRLHCPAASGECEKPKQVLPVSADINAKGLSDEVTGCDNQLSWWFTDEALVKKSEPPTGASEKGWEFSKYPPRCQNLLKELELLGEVRRD